MSSSFNVGPTHVDATRDRKQNRVSIDGERQALKRDANASLAQAAGAGEAAPGNSSNSASVAHPSISLLGLQRAAGNQAVSHLMRQSVSEHRRPAPRVEGQLSGAMYQLRVNNAGLLTVNGGPAPVSLASAYDPRSRTLLVQVRIGITATVELAGGAPDVLARAASRWQVRVQREPRRVPDSPTVFAPETVLELVSTPPPAIQPDTMAGPAAPTSTQAANDRVRSDISQNRVPPAQSEAAARRDFLQFFASTARRRTLQSLQRARETAQRERARYGLASWRAPAISTPTAGVIQPAASWYMASNAETRRLSENATRLLAQYRELRAARAQLGELVARQHLQSMLPASGSATLQPQTPPSELLAAPWAGEARLRLLDRTSVEDMTLLVQSLEQEWDGAVAEVTQDTPILGPIAARTDPRQELERIADGDAGAAAVLGETVDQRLTDIDVVENTLDDNRVWQLPNLIDRTETALGLTRGSREYEWVEAERRLREEDRRLRELVGGALVFAAAILAIPTAGTMTGAALAGAAAIGGLYQGAEAVAEYVRADAEANAVFDRAEAISSDDPSFFWLAVTVVGMVADASAALTAFRELRGAVVAVRAAPAGQRARELLRLRQRAEALHGGLGPPVEDATRQRLEREEATQTVRAGSSDPPLGRGTVSGPRPGTMPRLPPQPRAYDPRFLEPGQIPTGTWIEAPDAAEAQRWFRSWIGRDPNREVEILVFEHGGTRRWFVSQGDVGRGRRGLCAYDLGVNEDDLHSLEHYHNAYQRDRPGVPQVAHDILDVQLRQMPSYNDFMTWIESSRRLGRPWEARVTYILPDGRLGVTEVITDARAWAAGQSDAFRWHITEGPNAGARSAYAQPFDAYDHWILVSRGQSPLARPTGLLPGEGGLGGLPTGGSGAALGTAVGVSATTLPTRLNPLAEVLPWVRPQFAARAGLERAAFVAALDRLRTRWARLPEVTRSTLARDWRLGAMASVYDASEIQRVAAVWERVRSLPQADRWLDDFARAIRSETTVRGTVAEMDEAAELVDQGAQIIRVSDPTTSVRGTQVKGADIVLRDRVVDVKALDLNVFQADPRGRFPFVAYTEIRDLLEQAVRHHQRAAYHNLMVEFRLRPGPVPDFIANAFRDPAAFLQLMDLNCPFLNRAELRSAATEVAGASVNVAGRHITLRW